MVKATRGFTLVEILVALVLVEVGLLAVMGTSILARQVLTKAEILERGVAEVERTYDSLVQGWTAGTGVRVGASGWVRWLVSESGNLRVEFGLDPEVPVVRVDGVLPRGTSTP